MIASARAGFFDVENDEKRERHASYEVRAMTRRGVWLFIALSVIWGVPYLLIRIAVADVDPLLVAFGRTALGAAILLPIAYHRRALRPALRHWKALLLFTFLEIFAPWWLLGHAETKLTSSMAGLLIAVVPLTTAVLMRALGYERFDARRLFGLLLGFAGVAALVGIDFRPTETGAIVALLLTAVGYASGPIVIDRMLGGVPPIGVIACSLAIAALAYAPFVPGAWHGHVTPAAAAAIVALAVFCTALAFLLFFALIAEVGPARATVITYVNPAVALVLGVLLLSEPLTTGMLIGFPLVIAGSIIGTLRTAASREAQGTV